MKSKKIIYLLLAITMAASTACNKDKDSDDPIYVYTTSSSSTLVSSFSLQANTDVMNSLDSVFFTIDPERNMIYNADSLPVGTNISALKVKMTFNSSIGSAIFHIYDANHTKTDYEYSTTSSESIDFRYGVVLTVNSADGLHTKEYSVKVNVHQVEPDSIVWPVSARRDLPGSADENYHMGSAELGGVYFCLLQNSNGYVLSNAYSPMGPWTQVDIDWGFEPDVTTLTSSDETLYILDVNGNLYTLNNDTWQATGIKWHSIIGGYQNCVLGITDEPYCYDEYPRREAFTPKPVEEGFPINGSSQLVVTDVDWAVAPQAVLVGGKTSAGTLTSKSWGYDGQNWAAISNTSSKLPALDSPTLFCYNTFTINSPSIVAIKKDTWMVMGGKLSDGTLNKTTYVSNNRGISWETASSAYNLPSIISPFYGAHAHIYSVTINAKNNSPARRISQAITQWECPYIFLFGGYNSQGMLQNNIWQGVLLRLTYKPLQ